MHSECVSRFWRYRGPTTLARRCPRNRAKAYGRQQHHTRAIRLPRHRLARQSCNRVREACQKTQTPEDPWPPADGSPETSPKWVPSPSLMWESRGSAPGPAWPHPPETPTMNRAQKCDGRMHPNNGLLPAIPLRFSIAHPQSVLIRCQRGIWITRAFPWLPRYPALPSRRAA